MNLGNATLRSVTCIRPQLSHTPSKQSIAASEDYKSFSDYASDVGSSLDDRTTVLRWHTPPSHNMSNAKLENQQSEATLPVHRHKYERSSCAVPPNVRFDEAGLKAQEAAKTTNASTKPAESDTSPPTPGTDDTPYIQYAIEQLTRSSDAYDSRRPISQSSEETYPVARIIPDEGLGYMKKELNREASFRSEDPLPSESFEEQETFIPVETPGGSYLHPELDFVPGILRPLSLISLVLLFLLMAGLLVFCFIWSRQHNGLWDYRATSNSQYFVFGYLPQMLACLIVLALHCVENAVFRVMPFTVMSSANTTLRSKALFMDLIKTNFLLPRFDLFRSMDALVASCLAVFWLSVFTVPLQSSLFQVRLVDVGGQHTWRWVVVEPVLWPLVGIWAIIAISGLSLCFYFSGRHTGLKWDPVSLADIFTLLQRSNSLTDFSGSEIFENRKAFQDKLKQRTDRLGYWRTTKSDDIFYALAEEGAPTRRYSVQQGKLKEKEPEKLADRLGYDIEGQRPLRSVTNESLREKIFSPGIRYRTVPWFLRDTFVVAWVVISFVLLIAFLVVSFIHQAIQRGFRPLVDVAPNSTGFSPAGFLYSFLPSCIGMVLFLCWQSIDMRFRALQPFAMLANPKGASAAESLLLDYPSCFPVEATIKAAVSSHWKVAWISSIALASLALPVLGGGIFWAEYFPQSDEVRMVGQMGGFYTLVAVLTLCVFSLLIIWPRWKRYLPHDICTLAELISYVYQSPLLTDAAFHDPRSKTDLVTRLLSHAPGEAAPGQYALGVYLGRDNKEHLGIDRLQRRHYADMLVTTAGRM
ncbi:hypothetical protein FGG08_006684 [Glutinoglossum americanum]|uniref:Phosphoribosylaminoimidazole-succinocarboxamide synthase n=1 Tax=Glutinoglossum americanum TaxID=1670608 RepID=A0A9P8HS64_9PEZI|nr:hypothetical protein FGG08_006684 [Glutinoglossum americanum]